MFSLRLERTQLRVVAKSARSRLGFPKTHCEESDVAVREADPSFSNSRAVKMER